MGWNLKSDNMVLYLIFLLIHALVHCPVDIGRCASRSFETLGVILLSKEEGPQAALS